MSRCLNGLGVGLQNQLCEFESRPTLNLVLLIYTPLVKWYHDGLQNYSSRFEPWKACKNGRVTSSVCKTDLH
jgi:hypothetical protein